MKNVIVSSKISEKCKNALEEMGYNVLLLPPCTALSGNATDTHPDTLICKMRDGSLLVSDEYYAQAENILKMSGAKFTLTEEKLGKEYPSDILFNALRIGDTVIGRADVISEKIKKEAKKLVSVRQGYARCSVALLSEKAAVTQDRGLAKALDREGLDVLLISEGNIRLEGHPYGFIGGAGGLIEDGVYAFFGKIKAHPMGEQICEFAEKHGIKAISLSSEPLSDTGGLICI